MIPCDSTVGDSQMCDCLLGKAMKNGATSIFMGLLALMAGTSQASTTSDGVVYNVTASISTTAGYSFQATGTRTTKPECATSEVWYIPTPAAEKTRAQFAMLLTASATKQLVTVVGTGACDTSVPDRETVNTLYLQ